MSVSARVGSCVLECGAAFVAAGVVLGVLIPLMRRLGWTLSPSGTLVLIVAILLGFVALATLRPGGSLRPRR